MGLRALDLLGKIGAARPTPNGRATPPRGTPGIRTGPVRATGSGSGVASSSSVAGISAESLVSVAASEGGAGSSSAEPEASSDEAALKSSEGGGSAFSRAGRGGDRVHTRWMSNQTKPKARHLRTTAPLKSWLGESPSPSPREVRRQLAVP